MEGGRDERLRLFLALRLPDASSSGARRLAGARARGGQAAGRSSRPANLHVTLAFLGSRPAGELPAILDVLEEVGREAEPVRLDVTGYRETRSVGMLTLRDEAGAAARLAERPARGLAALGVYRREERPWLPHLTVLRFRERPRLPRAPLRPGGWVSSDAAAFLSRLHPSGARYEVHDSFRLGG